MIQREIWFKEAARPIPVDYKLVDHTVKVVWNRLLVALKTLSRTPSYRMTPDLLWDLKKAPSIDIKDVAGGSHKILLLATSHDYEEYPAVKGNYFRVGEGSYGKGFEAILVEFPILYKPAKLIPAFLKAKRETLQRELFKVLLHELTHAHDYIDIEKEKPPEEKDLGLVPSREDFKFWEDYYNNPREVRAFMQEIAYETLQLLGDPSMDPEIKENLGEAIQIVLKNHPTTKEMWEFLTQQNKKKFMQGVYRFLKERGY